MIDECKDVIILIDYLDIRAGLVAQRVSILLNADSEA